MSPIAQIKGEQYHEAEAIKSQFDLARPAFANKYNALSGPNKQVALDAITNWNFNAGAPTVARENALYVGLALLYISVGFMWFWIKSRD